MALVVMAAFPRPKQIKIICNSRRGTHRAILFTTPEAAALRFLTFRASQQPIRSAYLISQAHFLGCHQLQFIDKYQMAERLKLAVFSRWTRRTAQMKCGRARRRKFRPC